MRPARNASGRLFAVLDAFGTARQALVDRARHQRMSGTRLSSEEQELLTRSKCGSPAMMSLASLMMSLNCWTARSVRIVLYLGSLSISS